MTEAVTDKVDKLKIDEAVKTEGEDDADFVDPWNVASKSDTGIDYDKLIRKWKQD
jgi:hypothetical protein